ncbi:MAG: PorV/PorQ family protein [Bacteroidales bacterium]|nr:PorV/PorQ family protein [Bacteroidales bacterium]
MKKTIQYISGLLLILFPSAASAQALPFLASETDIASIGMGGAGVADVSAPAYSAFTNAAAVPFSEKTADFAAGYTMWQPSYVTSHTLSLGGAYNFRNKLGFSLGYSCGMYTPYDVTTVANVKKERFMPADMQLSAGLSWRFLPFMSVGANFGYARMSLAEKYSYNAFVTDLFFMSKLSDFTMALGVSNLGTAVHSSNNRTFYLPSSVTLGGGYDNTFAEKHGVKVNLDADYYWTLASVSVAAGAEYTYGDMVSVRAGYRYAGDNAVLPSYASVGAGAKLFDISLNLAYVIPIADSPLGNTFSIGLGYSF